MVYEGTRGVIWDEVGLRGVRRDEERSIGAKSGQEGSRRVKKWG